jgi:hypothetical protein
MIIGLGSSLDQSRQINNHLFSGRSLLRKSRPKFADFHGAGWGAGPSPFFGEGPEFGLDPAPAPGGVVSGHAADQRADLEVDRRTTR